MAYRGRRRYRPKSNYGYRSDGYEAARKHIQEAAQLSAELGGTDKDVKEYFFSLRGERLKAVLEAYGKKYGQDKRQYAEQTIPHWRSGSRKMSGLVAGRLFSLLPQHMPVSKKFELVESLWKFKGPSSRKSLYVGPDAHAAELTALVKKHFEEKVQSYVIDEAISQRFEWLAENDSQLCQQLRNHFLHLEKDQLSAASFDRIGVMLTQIQRADAPEQTLRQIFEVGKHKVEVEFSKDSEGISEQPPKPKRTPSGKSESENNLGCIVMIVVAVVIFLLLSAN